MQKTHVHLSHQFPFNSALKRRPLARMVVGLSHFLHTYIYLLENLFIYMPVFFFIYVRFRKRWSLHLHRGFGAIVFSADPVICAMRGGSKQPCGFQGTPIEKKT